MNTCFMTSAMKGSSMNIRNPEKHPAIADFICCFTHTWRGYKRTCVLANDNWASN